jgi:hypothetical protein
VVPASGHGNLLLVVAQREPGLLGGDRFGRSNTDRPCEPSLYVRIGRLRSVPNLTRRNKVVTKVPLAWIEAHH